jgi:uncharacterized protein (TIGR02117 family)
MDADPRAGLAAERAAGHDAGAMFARGLQFLARALAIALAIVALAGPGRQLQAAEFYVVRDRWHSGIVVARADIAAGAWPAGTVEHFAGCRCLELGWGDRAYYIAPHPTALMAVRAALVPSPSVLHIAGFAGPVRGAYPWAEVVRVPCTPGEFTALCRALGASFELDASGQAESLGPGLYGLRSEFYAARGRYWLGNTCNSWTLREARAGGVPTRVGPVGSWSSAAVTAEVRRLLRAK